MNFIAFDLETTGFIPGVDQITEIAAVRFKDGSPAEAFATLVNPGRDIPAVVTNITGITNEMVADKPKIEDLLAPFAEFCSNDIMVAHNAPFDFQFLVHDIKKHETIAPSGVLLDTCAMARKVFPGLINYKLGTLVQHLNFTTSTFHRAQDDSTYCGKLFWETLKKISQNDQIPALETLVQLSNNKALKFPVIEKTHKQLDLLTL